MKIEKRELLAALAFLQKSDWKQAHEIVQKDEQSPLACWAHGIVHLMEGDVANARYWYRMAKRDLPRDPSIQNEVAALRDALKE